MISSYTCAVTLPMLTSECKQLRMLYEILKIGFWSNKKCTEWPFTTNPHFVCNIYKTVCYKIEYWWHFDAGHVLGPSWLQDEFWLPELVKWYKCMWLVSQKKSRKIWKAYEICYYILFCIKITSLCLCRSLLYYSQTLIIQSVRDHGNSFELSIVEF